MTTVTNKNNSNSKPAATAVAQGNNGSTGSGGPDKAEVLQLIRNMKGEIDSWYTRSLTDLSMMHSKTTERIEAVRRQVQHQQGNSGAPHTIPAPTQPTVPATPPRRTSHQQQHHDDPMDSEWAQVGGILATPPSHSQRSSAMDRATPTGSPQQSERMPLDKLLNRISQTANSPPINFDTLYEQLANSERNSPIQDAGQPPASASKLVRPKFAPANATIPIDSIMQLKGQSQTTGKQLARIENGRPVVALVSGAGPNADDPVSFGIDPTTACRVLVEFKRKRVLQYESRHYVGPGEYVVVGGDRGEDVGLVIYTWAETNARGVQGIGLQGSSLTKSIGVGSGKVLRIASGFDVTQLLGMQAELEKRAVEVCMARVLEHGLPMLIVDAEYQFDKKKLTFFFEAQQRLDFRELVRDLFKAFRARIWMEAVEN